MLKRDFPLVLFCLAFAVLLYFLVVLPRYAPEPVQIIEPDIVSEPGFTGRVVMPKLEDIYVLDNSSGRDLRKLESFLQGRAAGLHFLSDKYFKSKGKRKGKKNIKTDDFSEGIPVDGILVGVLLELDSLGTFNFKDFIFSNTENEKFKTELAEHIRYFWRYPRAAIGKLDFWIPIRFLPNHRVDD